MVALSYNDNQLIDYLLADVHFSFKLLCLFQGWHDMQYIPVIYIRYISDMSDIFYIFKIGYFPFFFNITLLLDVTRSSATA